MYLTHGIDLAKARNARVAQDWILHPKRRMPEAETILKAVTGALCEFPRIIRSVRNIRSVETHDYSFINRKGETVCGRIEGIDDTERRPLVILDCGYKRDLFNFKLMGTVIASLGYRVMSVRSADELKGGEAEDYMDGVNFLRFASPEFSGLLDHRTAFVVISGGGNVLFRACSISQKFIDDNGVVCGVAISTYNSLRQQFAFMTDRLKDPNLSPNARRVLLDYQNYANRTGLTPDGDPTVFKMGSPGTYLPIIKIPVLHVHGREDDIVPVEGSIMNHRGMKEEGKDSNLIIVKGKGVHSDTGVLWRQPTNLIGMIASLMHATKYLDERVGPIFV